MVDPLADFLTRIRNAQMIGRTTVQVPYSRLKEDVAKVMKKNGFLLSITKEKLDGKVHSFLRIELPEKTLYLKRISKSGQRIYVSADDIRKVFNGFGVAIISTSQGVMTGYEARAKNIGGEFLCEIS